MSLYVILHFKFIQNNKIHYYLPPDLNITYEKQTFNPKYQFKELLLCSSARSLNKIKNISLPNICACGFPIFNLISVTLNWMRKKNTLQMLPLRPIVPVLSWSGHMWLYSSFFVVLPVSSNGLLDRTLYNFTGLLFRVVCIYFKICTVVLEVTETVGQA